MKIYYKLIKLDILAFGIAKDVFGKNIFTLEINSPISTGELKEILIQNHPEFKRLASFRIAVNSEYRNDDFLINENDEVAIIPPVAGG